MARSVSPRSSGDLGEPRERARDPALALRLARARKAPLAERPPRRRGCRARSPGRRSARACSRGPSGRRRAGRCREPRRDSARRRRSRRRSSRRGRGRRARALGRAGRSGRPAARVARSRCACAAATSPSASEVYARRTSTVARPASSPAASKRASLSSSSARARGDVTANARDAGLVRQRVAHRRGAGDLDEGLQRVFEQVPQARSAPSGWLMPDLRDVQRRGNRVGRSLERAERLDALRDELVGARQVAGDPARDAERVDADRLAGGKSLPARKLECTLEPGHRDLGRVACDPELPEELQRAPFVMRVSDLRGDGMALLGERHAGRRACRCGSRSPPRPSSASAPRVSSVRGGFEGGGEPPPWPRRARSGAARTAAERRRDGERRADACREQDVSSAARRFGVSRSSLRRAALPLGQRERPVRHAGPRPRAPRPASASRSRAYMRTVSSRR